MRDVWNALHSFYACFLRPRETVIGLLGDKKNGHKMWVGAVQHAKKKNKQGEERKKNSKEVEFEKTNTSFLPKRKERQTFESTCTYICS